MGQSYRAICNECETAYDVNDGGGFAFYMLHCNKCGAEKEVGFDELGELHLKYLKGLSAPHSVATAATDKAVKDNYPGEAISEKEYVKGVEKCAGKCECGGQFRLNAKPRCPKCKSTKHTIDPEDPGTCYD